MPCAPAQPTPRDRTRRFRVHREPPSSPTDPTSRAPIRRCRVFILPPRSLRVRVIKRLARGHVAKPPKVLAKLSRERTGIICIRVYMQVGMYICICASASEKLIHSLHEKILIDSRYESRLGGEILAGVYNTPPANSLPSSARLRVRRNIHPAFSASHRSRNRRM